MGPKKHILVVANVTAASDELRTALRDIAACQPADFTLIVPATRFGGGREAAHAALSAACERLRVEGLQIGGSVGDPDPIVAVSEAWDPKHYDEIVVSTLPMRFSKWLNAGVPVRIEKLTGAPVTHVIAHSPHVDWADRGREFDKPLVLDGRLTVRPPWEPPGETPIDLVIDPGQAFGTGSHATTRMCLELMISVQAAAPLVDLGCGSGVLAVAAARLGYRPVLAVDHDPAAVETTRANAAANGVEVEVRRVDLRTDPVPVAPIVVANLLTPLLIRCAAPLSEGAERVIASGILAEEAERVVAAFELSGLRERTRREARHGDGDWVTLLFEPA